jgi:hypothetical protein
MKSDDINMNTVFADEVKHVYDGAVLQNIGAISSEFEISRIIAYMGETRTIESSEGALHLLNIEDLLAERVACRQGLS